MRSRSFRLSRSACAFLLGVFVFGGPPLAFGQAPPSPASADSGPTDPLLERLRKMEEMNQALLKQVQAISRQNETLSRTVRDLSKKFDDPPPKPKPETEAPRTAGRRGSDRAGTSASGSDPTAPSVSESAARPSRSGASGAAPSTSSDTASGSSSGRAPSAPSVSESAARPSRGGGTGPGRKRIPLDAYYDQSRYGYLIQSEDQEFELRVNSLLQTDGRIYTQRYQNPVVSDFDVPRARLYFSGRMTKPIEYQLSFQRGNNSLDVLNAYVNFHYDDRLQVRVGRFKAPYTFEWYKVSAWEFLVPERSLFALNFGPNRHVGVMAWGFLFQERLEYAVGVFDGQRNSYQDFHNGKDVMALLDYKPFYQTKSAVKNLAIGGSLDDGRENNAPVPAALRTSTNASGNTISTGSGDNLVSVPFLALNSNVKEKGVRELWELHATYFYKGLSLLGAWDSGRNDFSLNSANARPVHVPVNGYFIQTAYILTGETRERLSIVDPLFPFDLRRGKFGLGAFEIQARFSELTVGRQVFSGGLADPNLWTNKADLLDVGLNWYLNKFTKIYFDWEHAVFAQPVYYRPGPGLQKTSDLFWLRLQLYF